MYRSMLLMFIAFTVMQFLFNKIAKTPTKFQKSLDFAKIL